MFPGPGGGLFGMMNQMQQMMNQMMQDPFMGFPPPMGPQQPQQFPGQHQQQAYVEELHPGATADGQQREEAIVEEPDDDAPGAAAHAQQQHQAHPSVPRFHPQPQQLAVPPPNPLFNPFGGFDSLLGGMLGAGMGMQVPAGGQVFSYSSSTVISSGPNGTYHSSTTSRQGPGGVRETQATVRDGRIGHESMTIARGMGDRERVVSRTRDSSGRVTTHEQNRGLDPAAAQQFDQEWRAQAQQAMPPWMQQQAAGAQRLQRGAGGGQRQQQLALPPAAGVAQQQQQAGVYGQQQQQYYGSGGGWQGGYRI